MWFLSSDFLVLSFGSVDSVTEIINVVNDEEIFHENC